MKRAMVWGAGGGIGSALVDQLSRAGWKTVSVVRDPRKVTDLTSNVIVADVGDLESVRRAVLGAAESFNEVDLWIYAVGDILSARVGELMPEEWERILDANLTGAYLTAHLSLPLLTEDAHLVFLGAVSERLRLPGLAAYASAKAGLEAFTDALRKEQRGRRVTLVRPKAVATRLWEKVPFAVPHGALSPQDLAERVLLAHEEGYSGVLNV
mgnify:CR=1 FL=1